MGSTFSYLRPNQTQALGNAVVVAIDGHGRNTQLAEQQHGGAGLGTTPGIDFNQSCGFVTVFSARKVKAAGPPARSLDSRSPA